MRKRFYIMMSIVVLIYSSMAAQKNKKKYNLFQRVFIPDSIYFKLEDAYKTEAIGFESGVNAGRNVLNLINRRDFTFKEGIYSFKGQGAHFPKRIFIFHNKKIYIFKSIGAFDPVGILYNYQECIKLLELPDVYVRKYLKAIAIYLEEEQGETYGKEIK